MPLWRDISWEQIQTGYFQSSYRDLVSPDLADEIAGDMRLSRLFETAFFDMSAPHVDRMDARDELRRYMHDEYGLNVDDVFDWDEWREAYAE